VIDWAYVAWSALWLLGLSVELSVLGVAYYHSTERGQKLSMVLGGKTYQAFLDLGLVLACIGFCALAPTWWQQALWDWPGRASLFSWYGIFAKNRRTRRLTHQVD